VGDFSRTVTGISDPAEYEAWYHTPRGAWISSIEFSLLMKLLPPSPRGSLLDVGCGTGHFSRLFANTGLEVTGVDPDHNALCFSRSYGARVSYVEGSATDLPFPEMAFDWCASVTSLCFVEKPVRALDEMWRVSRRGIILGLLNRRSLLYLKKHNRGAYRGARWDTVADVDGWCEVLMPSPDVTVHSSVWLPGGGHLARKLEPWMPTQPCWGGFLGVGLIKGKCTRIRKYLANKGAASVSKAPEQEVYRIHDLIPLYLKRQQPFA
jgi:SAM-dependent methyltransferase